MVKNELVGTIAITRCVARSSSIVVGIFLVFFVYYTWFSGIKRVQPTVEMYFLLPINRPATYEQACSVNH